MKEPKTNEDLIAKFGKVKDCPFCGKSTEDNIASVDTEGPIMNAPFGHVGCHTKGCAMWNTITRLDMWNTRNGVVPTANKENNHADG